MNKHDIDKPSQTNWKAVDKLEDADLYDEDLPELSETFWQNAVFIPGPKKQLTLRIDADVVEYFRAQGPDYQRRMNAVLRHYMEVQRRRS
ncbi:BrnA antitoxin family protein [Sulfobacillus thermosulfidooxidans]|uniref:BrnA antitoxin family protein n=1 Tax=Sulfobacillus thermosulfidooxidans TaxID=28034 RepID=UPI001FA8156C|nr:BrnA antitoxin family protein [Sulfobacillus thermosulfidooxidans]